MAKFNTLIELPGWMALELTDYFEKQYPVIFDRTQGQEMALGRKWCEVNLCTDNLLLLRAMETASQLLEYAIGFKGESYRLVEVMLVPLLYRLDKLLTPERAYRIVTGFPVFLSENYAKYAVGADPQLSMVRAYEQVLIERFTGVEAEQKNT